MIWKGVYSNIQEVPVHGSLDTQAWIDSQIKKLKSTLEDPTKLKEENQALRFLLGGSSAKVVDYGGSLALSYAAMGCPDKIEYHVVETPSLCQAAVSLDIPELKNVRFHNDPNINFEYDVLYTRTALQYANDWRHDLTSLLKTKPLWALLAHTSCGDIPTYLTTQNWYDHSIPYWFINQKELIDLMADLGYFLISNKKYQKIQGLFFDENGEHDIPWSHILKYTRNLVFTLKNEHS